MEKETFNLTIPQNSIWLTEKFYQANTISNVGGTLLFKEQVDLDKLESAINLFIKKNDIMRLSIELIDGIPHQYIRNYVPIKIERFFLNSEIELKEKERDFINIHFSIENSFLYKFRLIKLPNGLGGFNVTLHHIICDAWSMSILIDQIVTLYSKLKNRKHNRR